MSTEKVTEQDLIQVRENLKNIIPAKVVSTRFERCGNCRFQIDGFCQRFPPIPIGNSDGTVQGHWVHVGTEHWCGEWKAA